MSAMINLKDVVFHQMTFVVPIRLHAAERTLRLAMKVRVVVEVQYLLRVLDEVGERYEEIKYTN